jgi:hypothetical protein
MPMMRAELKVVDAAVIDALPFEHAGGIVQPMGQHVGLRVAPRHELAVEPDEAVAVVEGNHRRGCHNQILYTPWNSCF